MKLREFLFKPRWQSKNADVRRDAVASGADPELHDALPRLARDDPDAGVRLAALRRLADPGLAHALAHDDPDAGVRAAAMALWQDLLRGAHPAAPPVAERLRLLRAQDAAELIEYLARHGVEPELRAAALARSERVSLLVERALSDPDAELRTAALARIDDEEQLERVAEKARRTDKRIQRAARERLDALRIARGDAATIAARARDLCEALERLVHEPDGAARLPAIEADWQALGDALPAAMAIRFANAQRLFADARAPARPAASEASAERSRDPAAVLEPAPGPADPGDPDARGEAGAEAVPDASGESRDASASDATAACGPEGASGEAGTGPAPEAASSQAAPVTERIEATPAADDAAQTEVRREVRRGHLAAIDEALQALESALDAGESGAAHAAHARIANRRRELDGRLPRAMHARLTALAPRYAELRRWQRWADNQRRRQLCAEIETLADGSLHPDAIATRVREAQAEWQQLDAIEGPARSGAGLARRFHAACRSALEPARPYFEKRQELRQTHAQQIAALLARIASIDQHAQDVPALLALRRETAAALRDLDRVDPRERKLLAQALKDALAALDARIDQHHAEVEATRAALIGEAEALHGQDDLRAARNAARELQKRWQAVGNGRRRTDQAQWKVFRAALDAVFARADAERNERAAREAERHAQAEALCVELEALATSGEAPERGAVGRIDSAWRALGSRDPSLSKRYRAAQAALHEAAQRHALARRRVPYDTWLARYRECRAIEQSGVTPASREAWNAPTASDIAGEALQQRFATACDGVPVPGDDPQHRDLLIELEQLADIESPEADRERRMQLRLGKLSGHLRGTGPDSVEAEFADLLDRWTRVRSAPSDDQATRFDHAFERIASRVAGEA